MAPYKRVDLVVQAFNRLGLPLLVVGDGPERRRLQQLAGPTVTVLGRQSRQQVEALLSSCRAFVFAGLEDFGIAPVEAMAAGAPIIAFGKAGILDTVNCITSNSEDPTGIIYKDQSQDSLKDCVQYFEDKKIWKKFSNVNINNWAQKFGLETFQKKQ